MDLVTHLKFCTYLLCAIQCTVIKAHENSHLHTNKMYWELRDIVHNFSFAIDLNMSTDFNIYSTSRDLFSSKLHTVQTINNSLICDIIKGSLDQLSRAIKEHLARGLSQTLSFDAIHDLVPWNQDLLMIILEQHSTKVNINDRSCPQNLTPLEYSIKLHQYNLAQLLLDHKALIKSENASLVFQFVVANQNKQFMTNVLKAAKKEVLFISDDAIVLANTLCLLDFDCEMLNSITDTVKEYTTKGIPTVLTTFLLSGLCQPYKERYSGSLSKCRTCTTFNLCPISNSWTVYEGEITIGVAGCELPQLSAQNMHLKDFQSLVELRIPFVLTNISYFSELRKIWKRDILKELFGEVDLLAGPIPYGELFGEDFGIVSVTEFLAYMDNYALNSMSFDSNYISELPLYIFDGQIMNEDFKPYFTVPNIYSTWNHSHQYHQFIMGPRGSGAPFHFHCSALNYLAYGRKKWFLFPPGKAIYSKVHPSHWYMNNYRHLNDKPIECVQEDNQMVYVPSGWAHATINIDECIGMATEFDTFDC